MYDPLKLVQVLCTIVGAFGGFPKPPDVFKRVAQYEIIQWSLVFILAYQGGAGHDIELAFVVTVAMFILYKTVRWYERRNHI